MFVEGRIKFHMPVGVHRAHNTASKDLFRLLIQDPISEFITNVVSNTYPSTSPFPGSRPCLFMIQVKDLLPEMELEPSRDILGNTRPNCHRDLVTQSRVNTDVMYVSQVLNGKEPAAVRGTSSV